MAIKKLTPHEVKATIEALDKHRFEASGKAHIANAARALGIAHTSMRERVIQIKYDVHAPVREKAAPAELRQLTALKDENSRLRQLLTEAHRETLNDEAIYKLLGSVAAQPPEPPDWLVKITTKRGVSPEVPITIWSDWHCGEVVSFSETHGTNEFDKAIFERRVRRLVERTVDLLRNHGPGNYPGIVVNLIGDMVSGGLHPELAKTDEEEVIPAVLTCRDILIWAFDYLIEEFGKVYVPCAAGNHGRQTQKPEFKRYVYKSFDWLIYQLLVRHYAGNKRITFDVPDSNEVLYRVYGHRYLAMHGDMIAGRGGDGIIGCIGPITRGEMKVGRQQAAIRRDYDTLLMGHWHQTLWLPRVIVNNTLKGFDEYAHKFLRAPPSTPAQSLWLQHPKWGRTMHREIFLEDPLSDENAPWVSVLGAKT